MLIFHDFIKKYHVIFTMFLFLLWTFLISYFAYVPSIKSINRSFLPRKNDYGDNLTPTPRQWLWGQNTSVGIGLIELAEPSDLLNYKLFLKHCILQSILRIFLLFKFVWNKIFCSKYRVVCYVFWYGLVWHSVFNY